MSADRTEAGVVEWARDDVVELTIARAALGGRLFGYAPDGRVVWVKAGEGALAIGDIIQGQVSKATRRSLEVRVLATREPGPNRVDPFCAHVTRCGGCPWQALSRPQQLETLTRDIDHLLSRAVGSAIPWSAPWYDDGRTWRCTARLHSDGQGHIGFYGPQGLAEIDQCPVFHPTLNALLESLLSPVDSRAETRSFRDALRGGVSELKLSVAKESASATLAVSLIGFWSDAMLDAVRDALATLVMRSRSCHGATLTAHTDALLERGSGRDGHKRGSHKRGGYKRGGHKRGGHKKGERREGKHTAREHTAREHKDHRGSARGGRRAQRRRHERSAPTTLHYPQGLTPLYEEWGDPQNILSTPHPAGAFMQAHQRGNHALIERVVRGAEGAHRLLELYAGSGNLTLPLALADTTRTITALEYDERALTALSRATEHLMRDGARRVHVEVGSISALPSGEFDHVVLDPPRAGAATIIDALATLEARAITYISCHPAALARDLSALASRGWRVVEAQVFHLFPHSGHAEVYCRLERI